MVDDNGIECAIYNKNIYYNLTNAKRYLSITSTTLQRRIKQLKENNNIIIPLIKLSKSKKDIFIDKRVIEALQRPVFVGNEQQWLNELREVCRNINKEH